MTKAFQLIDCRSKWYDGRSPDGLPDGQHCAWTAIMEAYWDNAPLQKVLEAQLRKEIRCKSISRWNDSHDWNEVYETLKRLDI